MSQDEYPWRYSLRPEDVLSFAFPSDSQSYNELVGVFPLWGSRQDHVVWVGCQTSQHSVPLPPLRGYEEDLCLRNYGQ